jgi:hypothetical protein
VSDKETGRQHRRHRSRSEADQIAAEYEASGMSQEAFSRQSDTPLKTLARYVARYRKQKADGKEPHRWVAVEVAGHKTGGSELAVLLASGRRIEVKRGFDVGTFRQLVAVLEQA